MATTTSANSTPKLMGRAPLVLRTQYFIEAWMIKFILATFFRVTRIVSAGKLRPTLPEYTKRYPERPMLEHRVFLPGGDTKSQSSTGSIKPPLLISIHGGGFMVCDPQVDDAINRHFATSHGFLVLSVNYRLAPRHPFPDSVHDVAASVRAILADDSLVFDRSRVALIGFSAGGNLALAAAQLPGVREHVQFVVPFYPVVDFTGVYKGEYKTTKDGKPDMLKSMVPVFTWAYMKPGQDKKDPLLSPIYATKEELPQRLFFVTAEYDYLAHEAGIMASKWAGLSEDEAATLGNQWERNGIKFRQVPDVIHAWTHIPAKGEEEVVRKKGLDVLYTEVADWLKH